MITCPSPGVYKNVPAPVYHAWEAESNSGLLPLSKTPAHYLWAKNNPPEETPAMRLGTAVHSCVLEPDEFAQAYHTASRCDMLTADGKSCKNPGTAMCDGKWHCGVHKPKGGVIDPRIILPQADMDACILMRKNILDHPAASRLLALCEDREICLVWDDPVTGILMKARLDGICNVSGENVILDLKSSTDASLKGFSDSVYKRGYYCQGANYSNGARETGLGIFNSVVFICVESEQPHAVGVRRLRDDSLESGRAEIQRRLLVLEQCRKTNQYPAYSSAIEEVSLPNWAMRELESQ